MSYHSWNPGEQPSKASTKFYFQVKFEYGEICLMIDTVEFETYTTIDVRDIEFPLDSIALEDVISGTVNKLREKQKDVRAKAELEAKRIDDQIRDLLSLPSPQNKQVVNDDDIPF